MVNAAAMAEVNAREKATGIWLSLEARRDSANSSEWIAHLNGDCYEACQYCMNQAQAEIDSFLETAPTWAKEQ